MKKFLISVFALSILATSCSSDDDVTIQDDDNPEPTGTASFVLNEVAYLNNQVEIFNNGDAAGDLSDFFLCLGPGTYAQIGDLETEGNITLGAGEYLTITYAMPQANGGLGLYSSNQFTSADALVDFVQWGAAGSPRENVAVDAGLWSAGDFVDVVGDEDNSIVFDGEGNGVSNWVETTTVTFGAENVVTAPEANASVVLNEVAYLNNQVEIFNNGDVTVDLDGYFLCLGAGTYRQIGALSVEGNLQLAPGEFLTVAYEMPNATGGLGLYINNTGFTDASTLADFVQWGAAGSQRENIAVEAGLWTAGDFVEVAGSADNSIIFDGEGVGVENWNETATVTLGAENVLTTPEVNASVVLNEVAYLNNQVEIFNNGDVTVDLDGYFLCLGSGTYRQIGALSVEGNLQLAPGEFLTVAYEMPRDTGGLGLYINNTGFGNASTLADFVQWGAAGSQRENVAVEAGLWTAGDFLAVVGDENNTIVFDGEGNGVSNWAETTTVTFGAENVVTAPTSTSTRSVVLNEVQYGNLDQVEIYNNGDETVDLSSYWLCLGPGEYSQIGNLTPISGDIELAAGEFLVLPFNMSDSEGLGLYATGDFGSSEAIVDFVQWGTGGSPRENVAVGAGIWTAGDFLPAVANASNSIEYDGEGDASSDWDEQTTPSLGGANAN